MGSPRIAVVWYRCFWWRFWRCRFSVDYLRLDTTEILILSGERLIKSSSSPCWVFFIYCFLLWYFKTVESYKIVKIFIVWYFELCRVFCAANLSVWLPSLFLFWNYSLFFHFSVISLILSLLTYSFFRYSI